MWHAHVRGNPTAQTRILLNCRADQFNSMPPDYPAYALDLQMQI
jgi:hypothetical protein